MAFENSPVFLMPTLRERALTGPTATNSPTLFPLVGGSGAVIKLGELVMILDLHRQGLSVSAIARQLCVDRKTVRRASSRGWSRRNTNLGRRAIADRRSVRALS
jgi:Homeodomain-like domain-containing protein